MSDPVRTCIGCGARAPPRELVRLVARDGRVVLDGGEGGGRGAWLHGAPECLERAVKRRAFARAFRGKAALESPAALRDVLTGNRRND